MLAACRHSAVMLFIVHQQMAGILSSADGSAGGLVLQRVPVRISIRSPPFQWLVIYTPYIPLSYSVLTHGSIMLSSLSLDVLDAMLRDSDASLML